MPLDSEVATDLDLYLQQEAEDLDEPRSAVDAERFLRLLRRAQRKLAEVAEVAAASRAPIDRWQEEQSAVWQRETERMSGLLEGYLRVQHERAGVKTVNLPNGVLRLREPRARVVIDEPEVFVKWCETNGYLALLKLGPAPSMLGSAHTGTRSTDFALDGERYVAQFVTAEDGEVIPGAHLERATEPTFSVSKPEPG